MRSLAPTAFPLTIALLLPGSMWTPVSSSGVHVALLPAKCDPIAIPRQLRGVDALVDSAGLVARIPGVASDPREEVTVSLRLGTEATGFLVDVEAPTPVETELLNLVLFSMRTAGLRTESVRLVVLPGPTPVLRLERSVLCAPEASGGGGIRTPIAVGRVTSSSALPPATPSPRPVRTRIRISSTGVVQAVEFVEGSGVPEIDRGIADGVRRQRYQPALLDGRPVEVWLSNNRVELVP